MPVVELESLPDESKTWIFAAPAGLSDSQQKKVEEVVPQFLEQWAAHGLPVPAAWKLLDERFIMIAADERQSPSGCSIDALYRFMRDLGNDLGVDLLDSNQIYYRDSRAVHAVSRDQFRELASMGDVDGSTSVIDPSVDSLGAWRQEFERPAASSWHARLLHTPAS